MSRPFDLRQLGYFVAVAEELHFGRAARRLHIAQPPLSQQIRRLEDRLGLRLFERSTRRVELSEPGRLLYPAARRLLAAADAVDRTLGELRAGRAGRLRLGFVDSAAYELVPRYLRGFRARWPGIELELRHMTSDDQVEALAAGRLDLGIARAIGDPALVRAAVFAREPLHVAVPAEHRLYGESAVSLAALAGERMVGFDRERSRSLHAELTALHAAHGVSYSPAVEATEYSTILGLVAAGEGLAVVPAGVRTFRAPGLRYLPVVEPEASVRLVLLAPAEGTSAFVSEHFDAMAAELGELTEAILAAGADARLSPGQGSGGP